LSVAVALIQPINGSGIFGADNFLDRPVGVNSKTMQIQGRAVGLDPTQTYYSLVYNAGSAATGPNACVPVSPNTLSFAQMFIGKWSIAGDGVGTLNFVRRGKAYTSLSAIGTTSIRLDTQPQLGTPTVAAPARLVLQACSAIQSAGPS